MGKLIKFDHVNSEGNFEALLTHFDIDYEKRSGQLRALCPFHEDTNPSLSITLEARGDAKPNTWHCFGCKAKGSIIDFAALKLDSDLRTGATLVAEISGCGLAPPRASRGRKSSGRKSRTAAAQPANTSPEAAERPVTGSEAANGSEEGHDRPENSAEGPSRRSEDVSAVEAVAVNPPLRFTLPLVATHPYLEERVPPGLVLQFGLGVCDPGSRSMMAGRCCVPIHNPTGELIAYAGRYLGDDPKEPKWLLPKHFEKRYVLFNAHRVAGASAVVLVEGFFDAIRLHGLGVPALALMGTSVLPEQLDVLGALGVRRVGLMFDGDAEGQAAVSNAVEALAGVTYVRRATLPADGDPAAAPERDLRDCLQTLGF